MFPDVQLVLQVGAHPQPVQDDMLLSCYTPSQRGPIQWTD
jgi:hypothetical protein